jgi:hypothetical protein
MSSIRIDARERQAKDFPDAAINAAEPCRRPPHIRLRLKDGRGDQKMYGRNRAERCPFARRPYANIDLHICNTDGN